MLQKIMVRSFLIFLLLLSKAEATTLLQVYQDAFCYDPTFREAIAQEFADAEGVPISLANLLPSAAVAYNPAITRNIVGGPGAEQGTNTTHGYQVNLTLTQVIFDYSKIANLAIAKDVKRQAFATLNAATQDLQIRVAKAYFAVLADEDILLSAGSTKEAFAKQLEQIKEEYKVGIKTITDVYTARASYENSDADYIAAQTKLADDRENLRAITGILYCHLAPLNKKFPLISPKPNCIESWVQTAHIQNWSIKAAEFAKCAAMENIKQQAAGHLPTISAQGQYGINYTRNTGDPVTFFAPRGTSKIHNSSVNVNVEFPLFEGGGVVAKTDQAKYEYMVSCQKLEKQIRDISNLARQSFLGVILGINKINADIQTIEATEQSVKGMEASYKIGIGTLVDVLNQRQKVFQAERQYAVDRYDYVNNLLSLKLAAGTLSDQDLAAINAWLQCV